LQLPQRINSLNSQQFNGFPNLRLDNSLNITADIGNLHVNNNLDFANGNLILNNVDVTVGRQGTGTITGFSQRNFIVTGSAMVGGGLVRNTAGVPISLDFPIGTNLGSYTPLTIKYSGLPQSIKFRVADNLYNKLNFPEYVNKTQIIFELSKLLEYSIYLHRTCKVVTQSDTQNKSPAVFSRSNCDVYYEFKVSHDLALLIQTISKDKITIQQAIFNMNLDSNAQSQFVKTLLPEIKSLYERGHIYVLLPEEK
jgi:hypothetical protein